MISLPGIAVEKPGFPVPPFERGKLIPPPLVLPAFVSGLRCSPAPAGCWIMRGPKLPNALGGKKPVGIPWLNVAFGEIGDGVIALGNAGLPGEMELPGVETPYIAGSPFKFAVPQLEPGGVELELRIPVVRGPRCPMGLNPVRPN